MTPLPKLFPKTYEASRARFRRDLILVQRHWPSARLDSCPLAGDEDLTIDWIQADGLTKLDKLLILATGEHGIEGYVGSAMLQLFIEEFLPELMPHDTGLLLVHAINPWGMAHMRRTNRRNVDLNRNFSRDRKAFDRSINPEYAQMESFLNPKRAVGSWLRTNVSFTAKLFWYLVRLGPTRVRDATILGQYRFPKGLYFGGPSLREEPALVMDLMRKQFDRYGQVLLLDMHSGYGPRYQMRVVNSPLEPRASSRLELLFSYPLVVKADSDTYLATQGDMVDYAYRFVHKEMPSKRLYATSFEFGTLGESPLAYLRGLRTLVLENQLHWFGAESPRSRERVARDFEAMFRPREERWQAKSVVDARQAFYGILRAEGYLQGPGVDASQAETTDLPDWND